MKNFSRAIWCLCLVFGLSAISVFAGETETKTKRGKRAERPLVITAVPWGPTQTDVEAAKSRIEKSDAVRQELAGKKYRLVSFEYVEDSTAAKNLPSVPPTRFRVIFYDYTEDQTVIAENDFAGKEPISVRRMDYDTGVGGEELNAADEMIKKDGEFGKLYAQGKIEIYEAMPPVSNLNGERLVNVGVKNQETGENQVVGVSFKNEKVIRYADKAPPTSRATPDSCGIPSSGQGSTGAGVAGQYQLTITQNGATLWEMLVIRPSSSSGNSSERSGIEVRDVKYKGKSVLKRGHAPVLNVQYVGNACGPYRDWQYAEGYYQIPTSGVIYPNGETGGFAVLGDGQVATTAVESRDDSGNFRGVAVYQQDVGYGKELVMVSEMNAGWYRYIMEWRFAPDGTIRPRYGFASTTNSCVCNPRTHHVYWRFDFDVVSPINKIFKIERGRKFLTPVTTEASVFRSYQLNRGFVIQNSTGKEAYQITPNLTDGAVADTQGNLTDTFGAGDFWLMQFKGTAAAPGELDDPNTTSAINIAPWINNESLVDQDVVVWYGAHSYRADDTSLASGVDNRVINGVYVIGPDLRPIRW